LNIDSKQMIERTLGKWIVEASDLAGKKKVEIEQLKATLSRQIDGPARLAYAHVPMERPRQFVVIGTTNSAVYLVDPTGSRRFWPVAIQKFDVDAIRKDCDQLWAEATECEARGDSIRLSESLWGVAGKHQDARQEVDAWELILSELLSNRMPEADGRVRIALSDIWEVIQPDPTRRDRIGGMRISEVMQKLGYTRSAMWIDGKSVRSYIGPPVKLNLE
jgi:predicted P-loop ATPase